MNNPRAFAEADLNWKDYVVQDERLFRPAEVDLLVGDATKARKTLNWSPKYSFEELIREMVESDLRKASQAGGVREPLAPLHI